MDEKSVALSGALVALFRGIISRDAHTGHWNTVLAQQTQIEDYVSKIGLVLIVDAPDGYAYLKQQTDTEDHLDIPRLIPRHQLSYPVSVMLVLLRKQMLESDSGNNSDRLILSKQDFAELLRPYLKNTSNEVKQQNEIDANLARIKDMGFIRMFEGADGRFEVQRIIRGFVDAQWLGELDERLREYQATLQRDDHAGDNSEQDGFAQDEQSQEEFIS
jgi:hypothetical protein